MSPRAVGGVLILVAVLVMLSQLFRTQPVQVLVAVAILVGVAGGVMACDDDRMGV